VQIRTHLPIETLEEWVGLLRGPKKQALFYGPPGTGKTYVAQQLARHLAGGDGEVQTVQFHPSYSYEDFIEGLRPVFTDEAADGNSDRQTTSASIGYQVRPGAFLEFCKRARANDSATFVFVIDEINRAELGAVLGELMMLLEYRKSALSLPYSQKPFYVPENVIILATMNTADRSLALVDFALRRRFHAFQMLPDRNVLSSHFNESADDGELALEFFRPRPEAREQRRLRARPLLLDGRRHHRSRAVPNVALRAVPVPGGVLV
jgi:5-methylcytosine-specific restriction endonuclease McrBC GTP-binding regulatory subunit McrB